MFCSMGETIFGKILRGDVPCHKVYEDDLVLAFLDVNPISRGHTVVIPKEPAPTLDVLSDESAAALGRALPRICRGVKAATGCEAYNILQNNGALAHQAVLHVHFHVIAKPDSEQGLGLKWPAQRLDQAEAPALARAIREAIGG
jgi:histidine triad (HIT) family protein